MKKIPALLLLISLSSMASVLNITQMEADPNFELRFILKESLHQKNHVMLDCQSFIQKFDFYDQKGNLTSENYISIDECEEIYKNTKNCLDQSQSKCVDSNDIFNQNCDCL